MEDLELINKIKNPETQHQGFSLLVKKYQEKIYGLIRKMVIDHADADDLTQEVFIKVFQHFDQFRGDSQLYTWIYRIAANASLSFLANKKRRFFLPLVNVKKELGQKIEENMISGDQIQQLLQQAILQLPDKQRLVFHLKYYEEMSYEEISTITHTSIGALKASYHHAVKKIEYFLNNA